MRCPKCGCQEDRVIDSRASREGATIRRRRECLSCGNRYTTYEYVEEIPLLVKKRDGKVAEFDRNKLAKGIRLAAATTRGDKRRHHQKKPGPFPPASCGFGASIRCRRRTPAWQSQTGQTSCHIRFAVMGTVLSV